MTDIPPPAGSNLAAASIPRRRKEKFLESLSEDDFRDQVLRPLFSRLGLKDGRDLCGPDEEGKDAVFVQPQVMGPDDVWAVQTKKGRINMASKASANLQNAVAQLRTAAATPVSFIAKRLKQLPTKVILCASGKINSAAQKHICDEIKDPRLQFFDADDLIPLIDDNYPEFWLGIDAEILPYLRNLRRGIETANETLSIVDALPASGAKGAATDKLFVPLHVWHAKRQIAKKKGVTTRSTAIEHKSVEDLLSAPEKRILLLGDAGSGKSTIIRRLAYKLTEQAIESSDKLLIPILIRASDVADSEQASLAEIAATEAMSVSKSSSPAFSARELQEGKLVLFVDALDEVGKDEDKARVVGLLNRFSDQYPECRLFLTSRDETFLKELDGLANYGTYRLDALNMKQATQIIERVRRGGSLAPEQSKEIMRRIGEVHGVQLNPLLVTIFAATSQDNTKDVPANITELYKKFTEIMLGRWDAKKRLGEQVHGKIKDNVLCRIAYLMHSRRQKAIRASEFRQITEDWLRSIDRADEANQLLDEILLRSGLMRQIGESIEFRHFLLQEFFAGRGIPSDQNLVSLSHDPWWRRALIFFFGEHPEEASRLRALESAAEGENSAQTFNRAVTLGLAVQACYLVPVAERVEVATRVIEQLARVKGELLNAKDDGGPLPMTRFVSYYLLGREAVAFTALEGRVDELIALWKAQGLSEDELEGRVFWLLAGIIETGSVAKVEAIVKKFRPQEDRYVLGIYLGCVLLQHLRFVDGANRHAAEAVCLALSERIAPLRVLLLKEFESELLELQRDVPKALLPAPAAAKGGRT